MFAPLGDFLKRCTFLTAHLRNGRHISGQFTPPLHPTLQVSYCWINTVTPHPSGTGKPAAHCGHCADHSTAYFLRNKNGRNKNTQVM